MRAYVAGVILSLALPPGAAGEGGVDVPLPRERPDVAGARFAQAETSPPLPEPRPDPGAGPVDPGAPPLPDQRPADGAEVPLPEERPAGAAGVPLPAGKPAAESSTDPSVNGPGPSGGTDTQPAAEDASDPSPDAEAAAETGDVAGPPLPRPPPDHTAGEDDPSQPPPLEDVGVGLSPACPAIEEGRVSGRPLPPLRDEDACPVAAIYAISFVGSGRSVRLEPEAVLNCAFTERLDEFAAKVVEPAAARILDGTLTTLHIAGSYVCRNRNGQPDARPSEHGLANAIDISAFELEDGRIVSVEADWGGEGAAGDFLRHVHEAACGPFTTVLGPDADSFHQDHLHLDLQRRGADGRTTFCQ